jgi:hypothetical protein
MRARIFLRILSRVLHLFVDNRIGAIGGLFAFEAILPFLLKDKRPLNDLIL